MTARRHSSFGNFPFKKSPLDPSMGLAGRLQKYLAAIAAANGEKELAERYFLKASALLEQDIDDNIIAFIRMTILAEAYRSLGGQRFRKAALDSFGPLTGKYLTALSPWRNYLLNKTAFPGLNYRY